MSYWQFIIIFMIYRPLQGFAKEHADAPSYQERLVTDGAVPSAQDV
jgi:hypothetical protein